MWYKCLHLWYFLHLIIRSFMACSLPRARTSTLCYYNSCFRALAFRSSWLCLFVEYMHMESVPFSQVDLVFTRVYTHHHTFVSTIKAVKIKYFWWCRCALLYNFAYIYIIVKRRINFPLERIQMFFTSNLTESHHHPMLLSTTQ